MRVLKGLEFLYRSNQIPLQIHWTLSSQFSTLRWRMNRIILTILLLIIPAACHAGYSYTLAICAIFQDEAPYLREWIEFHKLVGVEHFYLYNHRSSDNYNAILLPYIASGLVELVEVTEEAKTIDEFNPLQSKCYTECLQKSKGVSKWVAFLDIDEYLFPVNNCLLKDVLNDYDAFGGLCVNWQIFGTSSVAKIPPERLMIETLTRCATESYPANFHVKSIVRPERASHFLNPHHPIYLKSFYQVNTDKIPFEGRFSNYMRINRLRINHYWTRDEDYFYNKKIPRQRRWRGTPNAQKLISEMNPEKNELILRYVPALREAMHMGINLPTFPIFCFIYLESA